MRAAPSRSCTTARWSAAATSGGYGWRVGKSLALGMVRPDLGEIGQELDITILGKDHRADDHAGSSPYDPENVSLRS